jgi:hypothetical protein
LNFTGRKLLLVSTCSDAKAGNEKLVYAGAKMVGTAFAHDPVALTRGLSPLNAKAGTRGIVNPRIKAILKDRMISGKFKDAWGATYTQMRPNKKKTRTLRVK